MTTPAEETERAATRALVYEHLRDHPHSTEYEMHSRLGSSLTRAALRGALLELAAMGHAQCAGRKWVAVDATTTDAVHKFFERRSGCTAQEVAGQLLVSVAEAERALCELVAQQRAYRRPGGLWWPMRPEPPPPKPRPLLVPERGLEDNRRNRRWLRLCDVLARHCASQEQTEELAWLVIRTVEETK